VLLYGSQLPTPLYRQYKDWYTCFAMNISEFYNWLADCLEGKKNPYKAEETILVTIDNQLRLVLFGVECVLNIELNTAEVERVFLDGENNSRGELHYIFWSDPSDEVTGYVEKYEEGTLWLTVNSKREYATKLSAINKRAEYQVFRWTNWINRHEEDPDI